MLVRNLGFKLLNMKLVMRSGSHHTPYDWRDDHSQNLDFQQNVRMVGVQRATEYVFPHQGPALTWLYSHPDNYDQKNLHTNLVSKGSVGLIANLIQAPHTDYQADIAHEFDYESEDLDFQPQTFQSQHFKKKGPIYMWIIAGSLPLWWFALEMFVQEWSDQDNYRYQRAPPLHYPNDQDTPDLQTWENFHSPYYQELYDAGVVKQPFFTFKDGKKVYSKWAGVNQPMQDL